MQSFSCFLRNDNNPMLATKAVLLGGVFNVFGDIFFVFTLDWGIFGAGLATCIGATLTLSTMLLHFKSKRNTLRLVRPKQIFKKIRRMVAIGFSTFFCDIAMGILTMLFNIQIMRYLGSDALAIYGIIVNVSTFVQCCGYAVGQASQPLLSANFAAGQPARIKQLFGYNVVTAALVGVAWVAVVVLWPTAFVYAFMTPTAEVLAIAPAILRVYGLSFLLLPFNIYATYFFQATMKARAAFSVSVLRGLVLSGALILLLPIFFAESSMWWAMPLSELAVCGLTVVMLATGGARRTKTI